MTPPGEDANRLLQRLAGRRALAQAAIYFERVCRAFWPVLGVAGLFIVLALLDVFHFVPVWLHLALLALAGGAIVLFALRAARALAWPDRRDGERRLEQASGLSHRPLTTLMDRPATTDAMGRALWQAHLARVARQIGQLRIGTPRPGLAALDRRALRLGLVLALLAAVVIAGRDAPGRLAASFRPEFAVAAAGPGIVVQGWITPPTYTRLAPVFLKADGSPVAVPAGSHLTLNITGASAPPEISFAGAAETLRGLDASSFQAERDLTEAGRLVLRSSGKETAAWDIHVIPDRPPVASWPEPPGPLPPEGRAPRLNTPLPWQVADDYGVVRLQVEIRLRDRPDTPALIIQIPISGGAPTAAKGIAQPNLVAHPWAGLDVTAWLVAHDALDQAGTSPTAGFALPERVFEHKVAKLLIAVRKQLSLTPEDRRGALSALRGVLAMPELLTGDYGAWLNLSAIASLLARDKTPGGIDAAQSRLWELALHLEDGGTERTQHALEAARQAAREALEQLRQSPEDAAKRAELERKLVELQNAIRQHLDALREEAKRELSEIPPDLDRLDQQTLDRLAEEAQQAAREGKPEEAQDRLAELERMLEEMRNAQVGQGAQEQRNAERRERGRQQMGVVQDLIAREGQIVDHAQPRNAGQDARQRRTFQLPDPQRDAPTANRAEEQGQDQRAQQALRRALGEMMQQAGDLTGKIPPAFNEAEQAMRDVAQALGQNQDGPATQAAQRAIDALQRGGREMGRQMARQFGPPRPGEGNDGQDGDPFGMGFSLQDGQSDQQGGGRDGRHGRRRQGENRDPLGRQLGQGTSGADDGTEVQVPEEMERQRTQNLQRELRRRGGERFRPQEELDYIERLLRQF